MCPLCGHEPKYQQNLAIKIIKTLKIIRIIKIVNIIKITIPPNVQRRLNSSSGSFMIFLNSKTDVSILTNWAVGWAVAFAVLVLRCGSVVHTGLESLSVWVASQLSAAVVRIVNSGSVSDRCISTRAGLTLHRSAAQFRWSLRTRRRQTRLDSPVSISWPSLFENLLTPRPNS
jgi:hypothetical protein